MKSQFVSNLCGVHGVGKILFVGKYEKEGIAKFIFVEHTLKFFTGFGDTLTIVGINYENDSLRVLKI
jgi:hypothetical protein